MAALASDDAGVHLSLLFGKKPNSWCMWVPDSLAARDADKAVTSHRHLGEIVRK